MSYFKRQLRLFEINKDNIAGSLKQILVNLFNLKNLEKVLVLSVEKDESEDEEGTANVQSTSSEVYTKEFKVSFLIPMLGAGYTSSKEDRLPQTGKGLQLHRGIVSLTVISQHLDIPGPTFENQQYQ